MAINQFLNYGIVFATRAAYDAAVALNGGSPFTVDIAPSDAKSMFAGSVITTNALPYIISGDLGVATNYIQLPDGAGGPGPVYGIYYTPSKIYANVLSTPVVETVYQPTAVGGWTNPQTYDMNFIWTGSMYTWDVTPTGSMTGTKAIGVRYWIEGWELPGFGELATSNTFRQYSRDASRTSEGMGFALRSYTGDGKTDHTHPCPTPLSNETWERFYMRIRLLPTGGDEDIWGVRGSIEGADALVRMGVSTTGTLKIYNKGNGAYPGTLMLTSAALTLGRWYKIDIDTKFRVFGVSNGSVSLYINGVLVGTGMNLGSNTGIDFGGNQKHSSSTIGAETSSTLRGAEIDFDDWIGAAPVAGGIPGNDLTSGSHVSQVRATGFGPAHQAGSWVGGWQGLLGSPGLGSDATQGLVGSTGNSVIDTTTDYSDEQSGTGALVVSALNAVVTGSVSDEIGYTLNGGAPVMSSPQAVAAGSSIGVLVSNAGTLPRSNLGALTMRIQKDAGSGTQTWTGLHATKEIIGFFGSEDLSPTEPTVVLPPRTGIHNSSYKEWSSFYAPAGTYKVMWGTYTGNDLGQDIIVPTGAHWFWARAQASLSVPGTFWQTGLVSAHNAQTERTQANFLAQFKLDSINGGVFSVAGTSSGCNKNATTYTWIAVHDPSGRFVRNGAFHHASNVASFLNTLDDAAFSPVGGFMFPEIISPNNTGVHYFKGVGHGTDTASLVGGSTVTSGIASLGLASLTSKTPLHNPSGTGAQSGYSLWRTTDASGVSGLVDFVTYTGNGAGARDIAVNMGGLTPLFAYVQPHSGAFSAYSRDPGNTGSHSQTITGVDSTVAIVGFDVDKVQVNTSLNANGVIYDVFVFRGGGVADTAPPTTTGFGLPPSSPTPPPPPPPPGSVGSGCVVTLAVEG